MTKNEQNRMDDLIARNKEHREYYGELYSRLDAISKDLNDSFHELGWLIINVSDALKTLYYAKERIKVMEENTK